MLKQFFAILANSPSQWRFEVHTLGAARMAHMFAPPHRGSLRRLPDIRLIVRRACVHVNFARKWRSGIHNVSEARASIYGLGSLILDEVWNPNRLRPDIPLKVARNGSCACGAGRCG